MNWATTTAPYALAGLAMAYAYDSRGELYVAGYDAEGVWLLRPHNGFAREKIESGRANGQLERKPRCEPG